MKFYRLLTTFYCLALISGCTDTRAKLDSAIDDLSLTASGRLTEVKYRANEAIKPVMETIDQVQKGAETIEEGVQKLQEGKEMVKDAIR